MTGKQYVLNQIQAIGANLIFAEYVGGAQRITNVNPDPLTIDDMNAVLVQVPGIVHASPVMPLDERIPIGGGKERDVRVWALIPNTNLSATCLFFPAVSSINRTRRRATK